MHRHSMGRAPDYTNAALVMGGINLFCLLVGLWASLGYAVALLTAVGLNALLTRLSTRPHA